MLKAFLVEDESIIRQSLRDNFPWEQSGFKFAGEAQDGEMALPMIRKIHPDVLITDIKMPFMDGLTLSHIVHEEFPDIRIIIISGYDDFEYARSAIAEGVDQYLLKPITRTSLLKALDETRAKIESEQEQREYLEKFQNEMNEYEQFFLRNFFEKVCTNNLSIQEIYEEASKHSIDINAPAYNLLLVSIQNKRNPSEEIKGARVEACQDELFRTFLRFAFCQIFRWNINTYGIMVKGEPDDIESRTNTCLHQVERICKGNEEEIDWYVAAGTPVERFSLLPDCFNDLNHLFSYRFFSPSKHILTKDIIEEVSAEGNDNALAGISTAQVDPMVIKNFLENGQTEDIAEFTSSYFGGMSQAIKSKMFRDYILLNVRFTTLSFVESLGYSQEDFFDSRESDTLKDLAANAQDTGEYMQRILERAILLRDRESADKSKMALGKALEYIDENYDKDTISLNAVADEIEISPNYFSTMFSQEMGITFIEYITEKRMKKARKLLRETDLHSAEIASEIGFRDPHYFSFVFKKTMGCTPREFRTKAKAKA